MLQELTDVDPNSEGLDNIKILVDNLVDHLKIFRKSISILNDDFLQCDNQIISLLVGNLERFDEKNKDESEAVHNCLGISENILEVKPSLSADCSKQGLLQWLLKRIKVFKTTDVERFTFLLN